MDEEKKKIDNPPPNIRAVHRSKVSQELDNRLESNDRVSVVGHSASGKSQFVRDFAAYTETKYRYTWVLDARELENEYRKLADHWELFPNIKQVDFYQIISRVNAEFNKWGLDGKKSLLIFDNVEKDFPEIATRDSDNTSKGAILRLSLPSSKYVKVIVTSRGEAIHFRSNILLTDDAYKMSQDEAIQVLKNWVSENQFDHPAAIQIINRFDHLPALISLAGSYIAKYESKTLADYLPDFNKNQVKVLGKGHLGLDKDLATSLKMHYESLPPEAQKLLLYCSYLPGKEIPKDLLLNLCEGSTELLDENLKEIRSLISKDTKSITIHEALQEIFIKTQQLSDEDVLKLARTCKEGQFCRFLLAHPTKAIFIYEKAIKALERKRFCFFSAISDEDKKELASYYSYLGASKNNLPSLNHPDAEADFLKALNLRKEIFGMNPLEIAESYEDLGYTLAIKGKKEAALENHEQALIIRKLSPEHQELVIAKSCSELGYSYLMLKDYDKAFEYYDSALQVRRTSLGDSHPDTIHSYDDLGFYYYNLMTKKNISDEEKIAHLQEAFNYYKNAINLRIKYFGNNDRLVATSYAHLGDILLRGGIDQGMALHLQRAALQIRKDLFGEDHPQTAISYNNVGRHFQAQGDFKKALKWYQKAYDVCERCFSKGARRITTCIDYIDGVSHTHNSKTNEKMGLYVYSHLCGKEYDHIKDQAKILFELLFPEINPSELEQLEKKEYFILDV